jgi:site-specific DNA-methyltransferase (adenine-specific)
MEIRTGDCLDVLKTMSANSVDAIVTDPPYGLAFMGKKWDYDVPSEEIWRECLRVLKPGGHLLAFAGTRTQHRMAVRIEDAGFEIRDIIAWVYGSGFPKSLDVSKAIDKAAGAEREVIGKVLGMGKQNPEWNGTAQGRAENSFKPEYNATAPATEAARQWQGWGTALKPALEPITVARKPLIGTVAENVLAHNTGALNVNGCRVGTDGGTAKGSKPMGEGNGIYGAGLHGACEITQLSAGRWPANLIHDGSEEVARLLNDAARFFYCAKASKRDRDEGLKGFEEKPTVSNMCSGSVQQSGEGERLDGNPLPKRANNHPTVKPTDLMRYLCRLVTPPGGTVLDPFMGSGSTGKAAMLEGFGFIGIERDPEYVKIAEARIGAAKDRAGLFG